MKSIPQEKHFAALVFDTKTIYHEGDERSWTNPGHGYSAFTEHIDTIDYIAFKNEEEIKKWTLEAEKRGKKYQLISCQPIKPVFKTDIEFQ